MKEAFHGVWMDKDGAEEDYDAIDARQYPTPLYRGAHRGKDCQTTGVVAAKGTPTEIRLSLNFVLVGVRGVVLGIYNF